MIEQLRRLIVSTNNFETKIITFAQRQLGVVSLDRQPPCSPYKWYFISIPRQPVSGLGHLYCPPRTLHTADTVQPQRPRAAPPQPPDQQRLWLLRYVRQVAPFCPTEADLQVLIWFFRQLVSQFTLFKLMFCNIFSQAIAAVIRKLCHHLAISLSLCCIFQSHEETPVAVARDSVTQHFLINLMINQDLPQEIG